MARLLLRLTSSSITLGFAKLYNLILIDSN